MATSELARPDLLVRDTAAAAARARRTGYVATQVIGALASLRLTVVLFAASIFLVFAGTLAQVDHGVWDVVNHTYFRVWFARIDFLAFERLVQMFHPVEWKLTGGLYFPGGKLLGALLLANLLAAHSMRFKVAAKGSRLWFGLALVAAGMLITTLAIRSGMNDTIESELSPAFASLLWHALRAGLAASVLLGAYALVLSLGRIRRTEWMILLGLNLLLGAMAAWLFLRPDVRLDDSGLRILWQLVKGLAAGGVLLAGCVLAFRQRAGIVLLHGGVALLMCSELWTGLTATEAQMTIAEGATANYAEDIRTSELAVVDRADLEHDRVTVVPASLLVGNVGRVDGIEHDELPFSVRVLRWLPNAQVREATGNDVNPATAGAGLRYVADEVRAGTGVDSRATVDRPAAYVEVLSNSGGTSLGTYLVSDILLEQPIDVDGKNYDLVLRFKRTYYPYTLTLREFRFDRYVGTNTPKNYSSLVELKDPARNVDREVLIWMNNPLRYAGVTYYQADFDQVTERATVLQVVSNPGWMAPYVACMLVATGMLAHFSIALTRFLRRRASELSLAGAGTRRSLAGGQEHAGSALATLSKWFPAMIVVVFAAYLGSKARMPQSPPSEMQVYEFAKLPLAYQGRIKPYDTVARNALQYLSGRQEVIGKAKGGWLARRQQRTPAIHWLLDVISGSDAADNHRIFRIENLELLDTLDLEHREGSWRYSAAELERKSDVLRNQIELASAQPETEQSLYQRKVIELAKKRNFYAMLTLSFRSLPTPAELQRLGITMEQLQQVVATLPTAQVPLPVPPTIVEGRWMPLMQAELQARQAHDSDRPANPAPTAISGMLLAYARGDATTFNQQLADYRRIVVDYEQSLHADAAQLQAARLKPAEVLSQRRVDFETFFNQFSPFYYATALYVVAFVLGAMSWLGWTTSLRRASIWLVWLTFALHTAALIARIYISGRPPVTNLYSSAVFIGWAVVLLAMVFESLYRLGLGNIVAAVVGVLTLLVAHFLSLDGDTLIVMQAVLDTQFWLATHVICITLGYATTFLAGAFGILYIKLGHLVPTLNEQQRRQLTRMTYGTLCFAIFFSFVGTVLGGLWADDSWGRFWGWDPKENGALIIVLYNALVLHARWGGMIGPRGLALLAIGGNIVTTWSWFGVNELGVGLHAYGASDSSTAMWLLVFAASQLGIILLGAMPREWLAPLYAGRRTAGR